MYGFAGALKVVRSTALLTKTLTTHKPLKRHHAQAASSFQDDRAMLMIFLRSQLPARSHEGGSVAASWKENHQHCFVIFETTMLCFNSASEEFVLFFHHQRLESCGHERPREPYQSRACHIEQWQRRTLRLQTDLIRLFARLRRLAEIRYLLDISSQLTAGRKGVDRPGFILLEVGAFHSLCLRIC